MPPYSTTDRDLSRLAGFDVIESTDTPGSFLWIRLANGHEVERSVAEFGDPDSAWLDAIETTIEATVSDASISYDKWDALPRDSQESLVRESFPSCPYHVAPLAENLA